jgi:hypothetical protein
MNSCYRHMIRASSIRKTQSIRNSQWLSLSPMSYVLCCFVFSFSFPSAPTLFQCLRRSAFHRGSVLLLAVHIRLYIYHCPGKRIVLQIVSLQKLVFTIAVLNLCHRPLGSCSRIMADVRLYINLCPVKRVVPEVVSHQNIVSSTAVLNPCFRALGPRPESWSCDDNGFVVVSMGSCSRRC